MEMDTVGKDSKKVARGERKRKKLLAEYELARSNDAAKRPGQLLDSNEDEVTKRARVVISDNAQRLSDVEFKKLKKQLADRKKFLQSLPRFLLQYAGNSAALSIAHAERSPILMSDLQQLLSYALYGNNFVAPPQRWCQLQKPNRLTNIVTLVIEGITTVDFFDHEHLFPNLTKHFENKVEVLAPACYGSSVIQELVRVCPAVGSKELLMEKALSIEHTADSQNGLKAFSVVFPVSSKKTNKQSQSKNRSNSIPSNLPSTDTFPRTSLLLSLCQMVMEGYPLPKHPNFGFCGEDTSHFKASKPEYTEVNAFSPMFAVDCEMCMTDVGKHELTRIAIVNEKLEVVYETLVKPRNKIVNYLTQYSGITKQLLADVTTTLEDVQECVQTLLPSDAILVGHSLNCDLKAINFYHPYVIDTSVIFNLTGMRQRKPKLVTLAQRFLSEEIQQSYKGHSPTEDATATMRLVLLKLAKGHPFGDALEDPNLTNENGYTVSMFQNSTKAKKTVAVIGSKETLASYSNICSDDSEHYKQILTTGSKNTIDRLLESAVLNDFSLAHVDFSKQLSLSKAPERREKAFKKLDRWIDSIFSHISVNGLCSIVFGGPKTISESEKTCGNSVGELDTVSSSVCNIKSNGSTDMNKNNIPEDSKSKVTPTGTDNSTDDNGSNNFIKTSESKVTTTIQSQPQGGQEKDQMSTRRRNGVVFIRVKSAK